MPGTAPRAATAAVPLRASTAPGPARLASHSGVGSRGESNPCSRPRQGHIRGGGAPAQPGAARVTILRPHAALYTASQSVSRVRSIVTRSIVTRTLVEHQAGGGMSRQYEQAVVRFRTGRPRPISGTCGLFLFLVLSFILRRLHTLRSALPV
jgi:hypothetical protein